MNKETLIEILSDPNEIAANTRLNEVIDNTRAFIARERLQLDKTELVEREEGLKYIDSLNEELMTLITLQKWLFLTEEITNE